MSCLVIMNNAISDSTANRHKAAIVSVLNNKNAISTNTNNAFRMTAGIDASKYRKTMSLVNKEINKVKQGKINNKVWNKTVELLTGLIANGKDDLSSCLRDLENYATRSNYTSAERSIEIIKSL